MNKLSKQTHSDFTSYPEKVIQFGEGNFMRAFVDWQIEKLNNQGLFGGSIAVVQPIAQGLADMLAEQDNLYTVLLNGILDGETIDSAEIVTCVNRVINPYSEHDEYMTLAENDNLEFIFSNTTEAGIQYVDTDTLLDTPQASFPGKLTALLYKRFTLGKKGFVIIPCELINHNGEKLKETVQQCSANWNLGADFDKWLEEENTFCSSLVDRIVPGYPRDSASQLHEKLGYIDNLMVKAEPFLIWVIEGPKWIEEKLPFSKAGLNVIVTDDMKPYRERKVHLLNGPHTAMMSLALLAGLETVEEVMLDADFSVFVDTLMNNEISAVVDLPMQELSSYAESVKERFKNPFVRHELTSIALNSISKFKSRLLPILQNYQTKKGTLPSHVTLALAGLITFYKGDKFPLADDADVLSFFADAWKDGDTVVEKVLANESFWGTDLTAIPNLTDSVKTSVSLILEKGSREAIKTLLD